MMGPLHKYQDPEHFDFLLDEIRKAGIKVLSDQKASSGKSFWFRQGLGLIHCGEWAEEMRYTAYLGYGHPFNPFLWIFDYKLLAKVEDILIKNGSEKINLNTESNGSS